MSETICTSEAEIGDVLITLTYPHGDGPPRASLRIEDRRSGQMLIMVDLSAEEFMSIMRSAATAVSGAWLPVRPGQLGKRWQRAVTDINRGDDVDLKAEQARDTYLADGWDAVRIDRTNFGRRVVAHRWIEDEPTGGGTR